jgi:hypothetical protein
MRIAHLALAAVVAGLAPTYAGCYDAEPLPPGFEDGYEPTYFDGHVVYYDDTGRPFYYLHGEVAWVPSTSPYYVGYNNDWKQHRDAYRRWYVHHGRSYADYNRGAGTYGPPPKEQ